MRIGRRLRSCVSTRGALLAVCVAAAVIAVVALSAAGGSPYLQLPFCLFFQGDAPPSNLTSDQLLDDLLTGAFGKRSCRSRYEFADYQKKATHKPSPYLLHKLRKQEALQKRCGPGTAPYRKTLRQLKSGEGAGC